HLSARLRIRPVHARRDLCLVEGDGRGNDRSAAPRTVFARVEPFAPQGVRDAASNANRSASGSFLPRRSARLRIPRQARAVKKNRCGTSPVSKISDKEDSTTTLGNSVELSVQHSVGEPIPEFNHRPEDGTK